ncbi:MAG: hypothetical protein KGM98_05640 [Bacteroidota bacterium]|nr:hypothetical protein [Bacteroidota bacterium]
MIGKFRLNNPFNTFLLLIYGLLLKLVWFIHPLVPVVMNSDGVLYNRMLGFLKPFLDRYPVVYSLISFLLLYTQALSFNQLINNRRMMQKSNYLPGMSYLLITSFFPEWNILSSALILNTMLIWLWAKISNLYNNPHAKTTLYNIGLVLGISMFLYFPSIAFVLLVVFALILTRPFRIEEWFVSVLGVLTPWYLLFAWLFLTNALYNYTMPQFKANYAFIISNHLYYLGIIPILFAAVMGGLFIQISSRKQLVQVRKNWGLLLLYLITALLIPFINRVYNFQYWILAAVPLSAFVAYFFFYPTKKWFPLSIHWLMVGFIYYLSYLKR